LASFVKERSSVEAVTKVLEACDEQKSGKIDGEDFRWAMIDLGYKLNKEEADHIVAFFAGEGATQFAFNDFVSKL
jgi:Ca2+-binding EF-hand superfamily protein